MGLARMVVRGVGNGGVGVVCVWVGLANMSILTRIW